MKIYAVTGELIEDPDLEKGWLESQSRVIVHHPAEPEVPAVVHDELMEGTDGLFKEVVDKPFVPAKDAWDEYETVQIYHPYTPEELANMSNPTELEQLRADTDFLLAMGGFV